MKLWRRVTFTLALGLLSALPVSPALAEEQTLVFQANLTIPIVGHTALGTLTTTFDDESLEGTWSFQGTINGQFAYAAGDGYSELSNGNPRVLTVVMTSIESWQMPGLGPPAMPAKATIRFTGALAYVSFGPVIGIPVSISPEMAFPLTSGTYVLTNPASGEKGIGTLPNTGESAGGFVSSNLSSITPLAILGMASILTLTGIAMFAVRQPRFLRS